MVAPQVAAMIVVCAVLLVAFIIVGVMITNPIRREPDNRTRPGFPADRRSRGGVPTAPPPPGNPTEDPAPRSGTKGE